MQHWDLRSLAVAPHQPEVLQSEGEGRSIVIQLPAGEALGEHQVHERAWLVVVDGDVELVQSGGTEPAGPGTSPCTTRPSATRCGRRATLGCYSCSRPGPARATRAIATEPPRFPRAGRVADVIDEARERLVSLRSSAIRTNQ